MKNSLLAVVLLMALTACQMNAQTQTSSSENLSDSSRALQFQIGSNFNIYSFQGSVISYKHHFTAKTALRLGLSITVGGINEDKSTDLYRQADSLIPGTQNNGDRNSSSIELSTQYIWYFNPASKLLLYGGAGPFLRYSYDFEKHEDIYASSVNPPEITLSEAKFRQWEPGIIGVIGTEWFASKVISFSAEYDVQARYLWYTTERNTTSPLGDISKTTTKAKGWSLSGNMIKFGLSLYFQ